MTVRLRRVLRVAHYAVKTEKSYTQWWERFEKFSGDRPETELGPDEVRAFLEDLAVERHVSAATHVMNRPGIGVRSPLDGGLRVVRKPR